MKVWGDVKLKCSWSFKAVTAERCWRHLKLCYLQTIFITIVKARGSKLFSAQVASVLRHKNSRIFRKTGAFTASFTCKETHLLDPPRATLASPVSSVKTTCAPALLNISFYLQARFFSARNLTDQRLTKYKALHKNGLRIFPPRSSEGKNILHNGLSFQ